MLTRHIPCLLLASVGLQAVAQSVTQTVPFNFSNSGPLPLTIATVGDFTATVQPFNPALGTLESFQVNWSIDFTASGIVTGVGGGGISSSGAGQTYFLNGIGYSGNGGGNGDGGPLGDPVSFSFNVGDTSVFLVSKAGVSYDPSILAAVLGVSSFPLSWPTGYGITGSDVSDVSGSAIGSVAITYNYVPEADTYAAAGLLVVAVGGVAWRRRSQSQAVQA